MDLAELQVRAFAGNLVLILPQRAKRDDRIQNLRRGAKCTRVQPDFFLPRLAVELKGNFRAVEHMRLLAGKIRRVLFGGLRLHFFAGIDLDQGF